MRAATLSVGVGWGAERHQTVRGCEELGTFSKLQEFKTEMEVGQSIGREEGRPLLRYSKVLASHLGHREPYTTFCISGGICVSIQVKAGRPAH